MKYIIIYDCVEIPYIFPKSIGHDDVAMAMTADRRFVISAGFVEIVNGKCVCTGMSTSLNIRSRPDQDALLINKLMGIDDAQS